MAFVSNEPDEQKQNQQTPVQTGAVAPTGGAVRLSPSSAVPSVGGGGTSGTGTSPTGAGGSFASLDKYLAANQGQAEPLANTITGGINKQYAGLDQQNQNILSGINNQVTSDPSQNPANYQTALASYLNTAGAGATPFRFPYSGPASAESQPAFQNQQTAINNAIQQGQTSTTTDAGRQQLIGQSAATPTAGVTALDSAILSQSPSALQSVENAYQPFQGLLTNLNTGAQGINAQIAKEQAQADNPFAGTGPVSPGGGNGPIGTPIGSGPSGNPVSPGKKNYKPIAGGF